MPFDRPDDDPWAQRLAAVARRVMGREPEFNRMNAWTDAAFPAALGGIPTMLFGPGLEGEPHGPTEHVMIEDLVSGAATLAAFLAEALG